MKTLHLPSKIKFPLIDPALQKFLIGRIWLEEELPFLQQTIQYHIHQNIVRREVGIQNKQCRRCQSKRLFYFNCSKCRGQCAYCINCLMMGRVSNCSNLVIWNGEQLNIPFKNNEMTWQGQLTDAQKRVADDSVKHERDYLIHAVTGAGKTEILFPIIEKYLQQNKRVCLATPRTDVVLELLPRLQQAFQQTEVQALYGGSGQSKLYSPLVLATTHQLIRFEGAFDVIIVDEADAFPYTYDKGLKRAVQKAKKPVARVILVTATPDFSTRMAFLKDESYSFLSRRFHGADLPVPHYAALWSYDKQIQKGRMPDKLKRWLKNCLHQGLPFLMFFPTIELMEQAILLCQKINPQIMSVHASDINRKESVQSLREGRIPGLLTTTILERGITIPKVQVAVVGAESRIFTASALIQISGRVGRSKDHTTGEVIFFHHGITRQMDEARKEIKRLNKQVMLK